MSWGKLLFAPSDFMPHGYCYLWNSGLVWLHVISDSLVALLLPEVAQVPSQR
jgi:hypothetical protein